MPPLARFRVLSCVVCFAVLACGDDGSRDDGFGTTFGPPSAETSETETDDVANGAETGSGEGEGGGGTTGGNVSACGEPLRGGFGDCVNDVQAVCGHARAQCLMNKVQDPDFGVCTLLCEDACDCWGDDLGGTAVPACLPLLSQGRHACALDCADGRQCPSGMRCIVQTSVVSFCAYDAADAETQ